MRQTPMDRWIEAAEANRFCLVAQQTFARPAEQTPFSIPLLMRLRSMARPETSDRCSVDAAVARPTVSA